MSALDRKQLADNIRTSISVVDVVGRYVKLSKSGNNHKGLCPFHNEATPSFLVSEEKGIYKCFGCGEGGDAISFLSKMEAISYGEALGRLAEHAGVDQKVLRQLRRNNDRNNFDKEFELLKFAQGFYQYYLLNTEEGKVALDYLTGRGITKDIIVQFGIGLAPRDGSLLIKALESNSHSFEVAKNAGLIGQGESGDYYSLFKSRVMFQVTNEQGHVVGFSGRTYLPVDEAQAKYVNSPESRVFQKSQIVYNLHEARKTARTTGKILLFEGFLDVIASHTAGFTESVATMGTALTASHAKTLSRHVREVVLVFDGDKAGLVATAKAIPILLATGLQVRVASIPDGLDPDDYVKQHGTRKFAHVVKHALGAIDFQYEYLKQGLRLDTTDGQVEFGRRLTAFGHQLPDQVMGKAMLQKWKNEQYEQRRDNRDGQRHGRANRGGQQQGLYRLQNNASSSALVTPKLQVISGEVKAEKELIYYMLADKRVFDLVLAQIGTAFNIDAHRKIVQGIEAYYAKHDVLNQAEFFSRLDPVMMRVAQDVVYEFRNWPKIWTREMIIELTGKVRSGALKLERAGKKEMFYRASHEQQLVMMGELTAGLVN